MSDALIAYAARNGCSVDEAKYRLARTPLGERMPGKLEPLSDAEEAARKERIEVALSEESARQALAKLGSYAELGLELGKLVDSKQAQYGNAVVVSRRIMEALYPGGIPAHALADALLLVRIADKMCRIATRSADRKDKGGESPYRDIGGYGMLGAKQDDDFARAVR